MSLHPEPVGPVPEETARVAHAAFPKGNPYLTLRDRLGTVYADAQFADLFSPRGRPAEAPWRLALVSVFQFAEGLSDRQAAEAIRSRIDWKYALGLELTDAGCDFSLLSSFRSRLVAGAAEERLLSVLLEACRAAGYLKERGTQRTDATHVLGALRVLSRLELLAETLRAALEAVAAAAPAWLAAQLDAGWQERYGRRVEEYRLPKGKAARQDYAVQIGADGHAFLASVAAAEAPATLRTLPAVATLRQVWVQQYAVMEGSVQLREPRDQPPAAQLIVSPYEPEVRSAAKRATHWIGYKIDLTETCEPDRPLLLTQVTTTAATTADVVALPQIQQGLAALALLPGRHLTDQGFISGPMLVHSAAQQIDLIGPAPQDTRWQARAGAGFALAAFAVDWAQQQVTCPQGQVSTGWFTSQTQRGEAISVTFAPAACTPCPVRARCTRARHGPRKLTLRPQAAHAALQARRVEQRTVAFATTYAARAGIEGTLSQGVRRCGLRQARYRGQRKTHLQHVATATALNIVRIAAWEAGVPRATTRRSRIAALTLPAPTTPVRLG